MTKKQELEKNTPKTAIYARVSTAGQKLESQIDELKSYCEKKGWSNVVVFAEKASGVDSDRPELAKMLKQCFKLEICRVVVYDLSRLSRRGVTDTIALMDKLKRNNVDLFSYHEDLSFEGELGLVQVSLFSAFANIDYELRREKQRIGIEKAKEANGGKAHWGGATRVRSTKNDKKIKQMREDGISIREISKRLGIGVSTVQRALKVIY
jgi:DNA invertase Pin-like site-specific DNA recombinase